MVKIAIKEVKAFDSEGREIKRGDIVEIVFSPEWNDHKWLQVGNKLRVQYWEDRSMGDNYICVFLESIKGGKLCQQGLKDKYLKVVTDEFIPKNN